MTERIEETMSASDKTRRLKSQCHLQTRHEEEGEWLLLLGETNLADVNYCICITSVFISVYVFCLFWLTGPQPKFHLQGITVETTNHFIFLVCVQICAHNFFFFFLSSFYRGYSVGFLYKYLKCGWFPTHIHPFGIWFSCS